MTPTERTLAYLRGLHLECGIVERWLPKARKRLDLFGFIDIIAIDKYQTIGVQSCGTAFSEHLKKIKAEPMVRRWLAYKNREVLLIGWRKLKQKKKDGKLSKVAKYEPRIKWITLEDLG